MTVFSRNVIVFLVSILLMHGEYFAGKFVAGGSGILFWSIFFFEMIKSEVRFVILVKFWSYLIPRTIILFYKCKKINLKKLFTFINLCHNIYQFPTWFKQCRRNTRITCWLLTHCLEASILRQEDRVLLKTCFDRLS